MASIPSEFAVQLAGATSSQDIETTMAKILKEEGQKQMQAEMAVSIQTNIDEQEGVITGFVDMVSKLPGRLDENSRNLKMLRRRPNRLLRKKEIHG